MKRYLVKIKRAANIYTYFLLISLFLSLILSASLPGTAQPNEKNSEESFVPALIIIEGGAGSAEEVGLYLSQKLVINDSGVTISVIPYGAGNLSEDIEAITYLNSLLEKGLIEVVLHGYDHRQTGVYEESQGTNSSLSANTNGIILESLWFKKRGERPPIYPQEPEVSEIEENLFSRAKKRIKDFYWYILEKLKVKPGKKLP